MLTPPAPDRLRHPARSALGALAVAGVAVWLSLGSLDVAGTQAAQTRVAALPPWPELAGLVALAAIVAALTALTRQPTTTARRPGSALVCDPHLSDAVRPLYALSLLALPYLPWLADLVPAVRLLAGPLKWLVWGVVLGQVAWMLVPRLTGRWHVRLSPGVASILIFVASAVIFIGVSRQVAQSGFFPGGDEPHYLVITQSLLRDRDLKIENNHARGDYREYFRVDLKPDYRTRGVDGEIYSIHPIGLPVLVAPVFAVGGYPAVVWFLALIAAGTATLLWRWIVTLTDSMGTATFAWAGVALSTPFVFNTFTVYPEVPAAFCVMTAAGILQPRSREGRKPASSARLGLAAAGVAALPWLSTKYAGVAVVLAVVLAWRQSRPGRAALVTVPVATSLLGWFSFFALYWGSPLPSVPYGPDPQMNPLTFASGGPGLFFDQEYGLCAYAPVFVLGLAGLAGMWRERATRRLASELAVVSLALLGVVGSFDLWWGGSTMPARYLTAIMPLLGAGIAWQYQRASQRPAGTAAAHLLLLITIVTTLTVTFVAGGRLTGQGRDGTSTLVEWLSPTWHAWTGVPTYIASSPGAAAFRTMVWLAGAAFVAWWCRRSTVFGPGRTALRVTMATTIVAAIAGSFVSILPGAPGQPRFDPQSRAAFPMLERYNTLVRPTVVQYNPMSLTAGSALPTLFSATAVPGQRTARQPRAVMLNARFRLPAGEYAVEIRGRAEDGGASQGLVGLQVGRAGKPLEQWQVSLAPGHAWRHRFELPLDAEFVGFQAEPVFERTVGSLRLEPLAIVEAPLRRHTEPVLSAAAYGSARVFFHEDDMYAEPDGFWTRGGSTQRATLVRPAGEGTTITLTVHCGPRPNAITFSTPAWSERVALVPDHARTIGVPLLKDRGPVPLRLTTDEGFVPSDVDPGSTDRRRLGCWISLVNEPSAFSLEP